MKYNALLSLLGILWWINPCLAEGAMPRIVSVVGEASEEIAPDQAVLSGQLMNKSKELADAKQQNDKLVQRVLKITAKFEIPRDKVVASNVYISPEFRFDQGTTKQTQIGYVVSRNLSITMDKLDIHEKLLSALVDGGIDQINGVRFAIADTDNLSDKLRIKAMQNAKERAESLAQAAGAKLGKVISIAMQGANSQVQIPLLKMSLAARTEISSEAPSLPGLTRIEESVLVTYELE